MKAMTPQNLHVFFIACEKFRLKNAMAFSPVSNRRTPGLLEQSLVVPSPELHQPEQNGDNKIILKT
jgi:hypothetical protein